MTQLVLIEPKKIDDAIKSIGERSQILDFDIHTTAVQCLLHAEKHGDPRKMNNLINALGKAHRAKTLKLWVETYSPIRWNGDGKVGILPKDSKKYVPFQIEEADAMKFWDLQQETVKKPLTLAALKKIVEGLTRKVDKAVEDGAIAEGENVIAMKDWIAKVQAAA